MVDMREWVLRKPSEHAGSRRPAPSLRPITAVAARLPAVGHGDDHLHPCPRNPGVDSAGLRLPTACTIGGPAWLLHGAQRQPLASSYGTQVPRELPPKVSAVRLGPA
jgi:hypothetical protein